MLNNELVANQQYTVLFVQLYLFFDLLNLFNLTKNKIK